MVSRCGTNSSVIHLASTDTMAAGVCESLCLMVDQFMVATIGQLRIKATDLSFASQDEEVPRSTLTKGDVSSDARHDETRSCSKAARLLSP